MDNEKQSAASVQSSNSCDLCGQIKPQMYENVCEGCVGETLVQHLQNLSTVLEVQYGKQLDKWIAHGRFDPGVSWQVGQGFLVRREHLLRFIRGVIMDAVREGEVWLDTPGSGGWTPAEFEELLSEVCAESDVIFRRMVTDHLSRAIRFASTKQAERELIETASEIRPARPPYSLGSAVSAAAHTYANPLPKPATVLMDLRYRPEEARSLYTQLFDGEIYPVWREIKESLPEEVLRLIPEDEGKW